jgi:hypothetical protein
MVSYAMENVVTVSDGLTLQIQYAYHAIVMTNKPRKRRPGGGRKPAGPIKGKTSNFSTRITARTRAALDAEVKASGGKSLSQVAERLLELGLAARRDRERDSATRGLLFVIGKIADECMLAAPSGKRFEWKTDPFICDALRVAVSLLIEHLRPPTESDIRREFSGGADVHELYRDVLASPEALARHVFLGVWGDLCSVGTQPVSDLQKALGPYEVDSELAEWSQYTYDIDRARRDLGFKESKS